MFNAPLHRKREALLGGYDLRDEAVRTLAEMERYAALNAIAEISNNYIVDAMRIGEELTKNGLKSPLHGARILLKDNIDTADGMMNTAGSLALSGNFPPTDATLVRKLREAGALIVGKTNMTELANYFAKDMKNGYSSRGGSVLCPYDRNSDPSGSSSGSAVAACLGFCDVAIGTETSGSIVSPSSHQGIVGLKPTTGRVSRAGVIPISKTLDTPGPMARHAQDCAEALAVIAGEDARDAATLGLEPYRIPTMPRNLNGFRIGVNETEIQSLEPAVRTNLEISLSMLAEDGAEIVRGVEMELWMGIGGEIMLEEFRDSINEYLRGSGLSGMDLKKIVEFNRENAEKCLAYGQAALLRALDHPGGFGSPKHMELLRERTKKQAETVSLFSKHRIDAMILPCGTDVPAILGLPSLVVPNGMNGRLPTALFMMAPPCREDVLLMLAMAYERLRGVEIRPSLADW